MEEKFDLQLMKFKFTPGDVLIVRVSGTMQRDKVQELENKIASYLPPHTNVLVINANSVELVGVINISDDLTT